MQTLRFGELTVDAVSDGRLLLDFAGMFPGRPVEAFAAHGGIEGALISAQLTTFVIRTGGRTLLVDTGLGLSTGRFQGESGRLPDELRRAGIDRQRVDAVIFTHLHLDHIGWNMLDENGTPAPMFPNARYIIHRPEYEHWAEAGGGVIRRNVLPLAESGHLELVEDGHEPAPGVALLGTPGHTPGHVCVLLTGGGAGAIITGDAAHHPAELEHPDWSPAFDHDPALSATSRAALAERLEREGLLALGGHFPPPLAGRLVRVEGRRTYVVRDA